MQTPDRDAERAPCGECGELISVDASVCPHCDFNPGREAYRGPIALIGLGSLLTIFIVTAVIGVPMAVVGLIWGAYVWKTETPSPTNK